MHCDVDGLVQASGATSGFIVGRSVVLEWQHATLGRLGTASLVWRGPVVHWEGLWVSRCGPGILTGLADTVPRFFHGYGIERITAVGVRDVAWQWLEAIGFEPVKKEPEWLTQAWRDTIECPDLDLNDPLSEIFVLTLGDQSRAAAYTAWKRGEGAQPAWHQSIVQRRRLAA